jgi:hypothetical protein
MRGQLIVLWIQTIYYLLTAIWPLVHIESFMDVTGHKTDTWLVKTVGMLLLAISVTFLFSLLTKKLSSGTIVLALACCAAFLLVDCYFAFKGVISEIYMGDASIQFILIIAWVVVLSKKKNSQFLKK